VLGCLGGGCEGRVEVVLFCCGRRVLDFESARLLLLVERLGSLLAACRVVGLAYSRCWERVARVERVVGVRVVVSRRGARGGSRLTDAGRWLLREYSRVYRRVTGRCFEEDAVAGVGGVVGGGPVYAGSHDVLVSRLFGRLRDEGVGWEVYWVGSLKGLASVVLGDAVVAGVHLFNPSTGRYNVDYVALESVGGVDLVLVRGFERLQGVALRERMGLGEVLEGLRGGRLRLVNRNPGSGTRVLIEELLGGARPPGYDYVVYSHLEAAEAVASGRGDVTVCVRWAAEAYGLYFIPLRWERFDFVLRRESLGSGPVSGFLELLRSDWFRGLVSSSSGYRLPADAGRVVWPRDLSGNG